MFLGEGKTHLKFNETIFQAALTILPITHSMLEK